MSISGRC